MTLEEMIKRGGYGIVDDELKQRRSVSPSRFCEEGLCSFCFGEVATTAQVKAEFARRKMRPAGLEELLAYGAKHLNEPGRYGILALGAEIAVREGAPRIVQLGSTGPPGAEYSIRTLLLYPRDPGGRGWAAHARFLAAPM